MIVLIKQFWLALVLMITSIILPAFVSFDSFLDSLLWPGLLIIGIIVAIIQFFAIRKKQ